MKNNILGRNGFTLMEILIAMTIMGILASIGYAAFTISLQKSRDAARKSDLGQMASALEAYNNDYGVYPRSCNGTIGACLGGNFSCAWGAPFEDDDNVYMRQLPIEVKSGWSYLYLVGTGQKSYQLYARLENDRDPNYVLQAGTACTSGAEECTYGLSSANVGLQPPLQTSTCL